MNKQYFDAVRLERTVMAFLLFFIVVVAAFGIMNTLITVTVLSFARWPFPPTSRRASIR